MIENETDQLSRSEYFTKVFDEIVETIDQYTFTLELNEKNIEKLKIESPTQLIEVICHNNLMIVTGIIQDMIFNFSQSKVSYKSFNSSPLHISNFSDKLRAISDNKYVFEESVIISDILEAIDLDDIYFDEPNSTPEGLKKEIDHFTEDIYNLLVRNDRNDIDTLVTMSNHIIKYHTTKSQYGLDSVISVDDYELRSDLLSAGKVLHQDIVLLRILLWYIANNPTMLKYTNKPKNTKKKK